MPPQHAEEIRHRAGERMRARGPRQQRVLAWLAASLALGVVAALATGAAMLTPTGSRTTVDTSASGATPADAAVTTGIRSDAHASGRPHAPTKAKARGKAKASASAGPQTSSSNPPTESTSGTATVSGWPNARNTGVRDGVELHSCGTRITSGGTYDGCRFDGDVTVLANQVKITRSLIKGSVNAGSGDQQTGLVITDTTIDCGCLADETQTPAAIMESNYTLLRVDIFNAGHGAAVKNNVTIQDSFIHGLGANTEAHKDGIYSGDGSNVVIRHNNIECNDGSRAGCTSAIGLLTDFGPISHWTIDDNLLNTNGSYCFYGSGGPQKHYRTDHILFVNNHFGRSVSAKCGFWGPVTYFDVNAAGNVWSGNVWDNSGDPVPASY